MGLGQYNSPGEYCGPPTASSVFLILVLQSWGGALIGDFPAASPMSYQVRWGGTGHRRFVFEQVANQFPSLFPKRKTTLLAR